MKKLTLKKTNFSRPQLAIFVLAFGLIGLLLIKTFAAAPLVGSLEAEQMSTNVPNGFTTSLTSGTTINTPYEWAFDPGTTTSAGYFFADGRQLAKITGPGPYVFKLSASALTTGSHKFGHAWDTSTGVHQTPPSAYSVTVNKTGKTGFITNLSSGMTVNTPYEWAFDAGTPTSAGYFFADGRQLAKITGPGPYVFKLNPGVLSAGSHKFGHAWDTSAGVHQTPPSAYSVTVNNSTSSASGSSVISDSTASSGKSVKIGAGIKLSGAISLSTAATSLSVMAHGEQCSTGGWPQMNVSVDGASLINTTVSSGGWTGYTASVSLGIGTHSLTITNSSSGSCLPNLYADVSNFYGPNVITPPPTVTLSVTPTSVTAGSSATLTWASTNADKGCLATGAWSGAEPASGSVSTGALNQNSTYTLTCNGSGGSASASTSVSVTSTTSSYAAATNFPTPAFTAIRTINVSTQSALMSAWNNIQPGDLINVAPTTLTGEVIFANKQLSNWAEIHFAPGVKFVGVTTGTFPSVWVNNIGHVRFYGGEVTNAASGATVGSGILIYDSSYVTWWNFVAHDTAGTGFGVQGITKANDNLDIKGEIYDWGHNLSADPHVEKGTGIHGANIADANYGVKNSRFAFHNHDGPTGAGMELGGSKSTDGAWNNTFYLWCQNLKFQATSQVAGNCLQVWGGNVLNNDIKYLEAENLQGRPFDANGMYGGQSLSTNKVEYGIASNTNLNPYLSKTEPSISSNMKWDIRYGPTQFLNVSPKP